MHISVLSSFHSHGARRVSAVQVDAVIPTDLSCGRCSPMARVPAVVQSVQSVQMRGCLVFKDSKIALPQHLDLLIFWLFIKHLSSAILPLSLLYIFYSLHLISGSRYHLHCNLFLGHISTLSLTWIFAALPHSKAISKASAFLVDSTSTLALRCLTSNPFTRPPRHTPSFASPLGCIFLHCYGTLQGCLQLSLQNRQCPHWPERAHQALRHSGGRLQTFGQACSEAPLYCYHIVVVSIDLESR